MIASLPAAARGGARALRDVDPAESRGRRRLDGRDRAQQPRQRRAASSATIDAARADYAASLRAYRDYDDRWALAFLLEDIGVLAALAGDSADAIRLVGAALALREEIGAPRPPALEEELETAFAAARAALGAGGATVENEGGT